MDAVYDRGSLVALDDADRRRYAAMLARHLPAAAPQLVVTVAYDASRMTGPPFCVDAAQMDALFGEGFDIESLESGEIIDEEPRFRERGLDYWADPFKKRPGEINHNDGGRGVYFDDPDGHVLEILTRPYGSGGSG